jgi:N-acetylmuramic acid 6-phosphate etherase
MSAADEEAVRAVRRRLGPLCRLADRAAAALRGGGRIFFIGAGTSGRLAAAEAAECRPTFGLPLSRVRAVVAGGHAALSRPVEGAEDDRAAARRAIRRLRVGPRDLAIGVSASGTTPFVRAALDQARARGASCALLACNPAPGAIVLATGPEIVGGSTRLKAGTACKLALNMITTAAMTRLHRTYAGLMVDVRATNAKLRRRAERIVREATGARAGPARRALKLAGGSVKTAIAMIATGSDPSTARSLLRAHGGSLRSILNGVR